MSSKVRVKHLQYRASFSTVLILLLVLPDQPWRRRRLVSRAYGIGRQYSALADGNHLNDLVHSWPVVIWNTVVVSASWSKYLVLKYTHIHNVVIYNESRPFSLLLVSYTNLADAAITAEKVIQVLPSDLIAEVFYKEDSICTSWKLCLDIVSSSRRGRIDVENLLLVLQGP
jgi:hypothetical protein